MKRLLLALALTSCTTTQKSIERRVEVRQSDVTPEIEALREDIRRLDYYIDHERCFTVYAICLGEKKKASKECWASHEACVIRVYKQWKGVK